ncbi:MAG TPA: glutathione peroxidase [Geminicoccus sp.]|jgi:glutathione peroxidase|uniref:glutathione peroxidase n=1 Tax=Geminicoccus sp. TaxID=2024832 RepID=UPI002E2EE2A7|nr:glutathione peroxidase [Geminicoccus sp.]HEX2529739.1 glutathione peroxidase [Geminicoccus sp.]
MASNSSLIPAAALLLLAMLSPAAAAEKTAWDFSLTRIEGGALPLQEFAGRPVLLVNTASMCGFTYQYEGLQAVWEQNRERGLVVLGVPSGDFGGQEYGTSGEIKEFCEVNFAIDFPMTEKEHVRGTDAHPLYRWLVATLGPEAEPRWNFHKILIGPDGLPRGAWGSRTEPDDPSITAAIDQALQASAKPAPGGG